MKNLIFLLITLLFASCALKEPKLIKYKQDIDPFARDIKPLHVEIKKFNSHYYMPWGIESLNMSKKSASWANRVFFKNKKFYSENTLPWSLKEIKPIIKATNFEKFNTIDMYAIISKNSQIRNLPTNKPFFRNFKRAGEGYPFDYLQNSRVHIGTPLFISHYSSDGSWAFVQNPFSCGWVPANSIAILDKNETKEYIDTPKIVIIKDNTPLYTKHQKFYSHAQLGALLPLAREDEQFFYSYIFINSFINTNQKIELIIPKIFAKRFPLFFTQKNIKKAVNELLNQRYGWGGYLANRDCSAMTKDFFSLFGVWLPRNSAAQKRAGEYIDLNGKNSAQKESIISQNAIPFRTLVYLKGHIMLYIGESKNRAIVLQNLWGLRTQTDGKIQRYIIGKTIISDLHLGENLNNIQKKSILIKRVQGITIIR